MVQKVVYNSCFGGYAVSCEAVEWIREQDADDWNEVTEADIEEAHEIAVSGEYYPNGSGPKKDYHDVYGISRTNRLLALMVAGETSYDGRINGDCASLRVAEVPDGIKWTIHSYDGQETVEQQSMTFS